MNSRRKILLSSAVLVLFTFILIGVARTVSIDVTCTPDSISPDGSTTITVECDEAATGSITVTTPGGSSSSVSITVPAGGSASAKYPEEFGASTSELGEYTVAVTLNGVEKKFYANFWVFFGVVIPDFPIVGTAGAAIAMLSGLGLRVIKRRTLK